MQRELTISRDEAVYEGRHTVSGDGRSGAASAGLAVLMFLLIGICLGAGAVDQPQGLR